jgi:hypothetical protein
MRKARRASAFVVVLVLGLIMGSAYSAIGASEDQTIYACVYDASGIITRVRVGTPYTCPRGYSLISWNNQGVAGEAGLTWRGAWDSTTTYVAGDAVNYFGSSYIAVAVNTNTQPGGGGAWDLLAAQGMQGEPGNDGAPGQAGPGVPTIAGIVYSNDSDPVTWSGRGFSITETGDTSFTIRFPVGTWTNIPACTVTTWGELQPAATLGNQWYSGDGSGTTDVVFAGPVYGFQFVCAQIQA